MKIALLYEHPTWSEKLIDCFLEKGVDVTPVNVNGLRFETGRLDVAFDAVVNRVNVMPSEGCDPSVVFHTVHFLHWLDIAGVPVINGAKAHCAGSSKALQNGIFAKLGLDFPRAIAIHQTDDALPAAEAIGYPVIVKPNIGGSGRHIARYDQADELRRAINEHALQLGVDNSGLVQEYIVSDGYVYRIEILGDQLFYAIKQQVVDNQFNYCAADGCHVPEKTSRQEREFDHCPVGSTADLKRFEPSDPLVAKAVSIVREATADVGGVEFLLSRKTGQPCFYDFNPYSNFVRDGERLLGFSPEQRYVAFVTAKSQEKIKQRAGLRFLG